MRCDALEPVAHPGDIGAIVLIDRRVEADPDNLRLGYCRFHIRREAQVSGRFLYGDEFRQSWLIDGGTVRRQARNGRFVEVDAGHVVPALGQARRCHASQVPQSIDRDSHVILGSVRMFGNGFQSPVPE